MAICSHLLLSLPPVGSDSSMEIDFIMDHTQPIDPRKTIFIGEVPRTLKACELAMLFFSRYGGVYAGIDCDPEFKYPIGVLTLLSLSLFVYFATLLATHPVL